MDAATAVVVALGFVVVGVSAVVGGLYGAWRIGRGEVARLRDQLAAEKKRAAADLALERRRGDKLAAFARAIERDRAEADRLVGADPRSAVELLFAGADPAGAGEAVDGGSADGGRGVADESRVDVARPDDVEGDSESPDA